MQQLPTRKFEIFDDVRIYRTRLKSKADGGEETINACGVSVRPRREARNDEAGSMAEIKRTV